VTGGEPSASAGGTIAFEVDDLPALVADLRAKDVTVAAEGIESPVCRMAIIKDPEGNSIILHKLKSAEERAGN
jgi:predicted enzyme related to lactoylglutathione lyase